MTESADRQYHDRMKTVTIKLPDRLAAWLARRSAELGRPESELIREALERFAHGAAGQSCHDALADVCGVIDGSKELSIKHIHLAGFGRGRLRRRARPAR